ncbi:glycosyltransferase family 1 protein [Prolixibacteraceae bacterium Z1-6]|uniref:Glycosyltransferase family 1 protein n=1 Tax=Draconibacterium aestuarii TaxID=2998507 RepID=A0A9X3F8R4_9BACT|nr:glycosyltransferase family 1 protein [Prolixibacteraceae bacterium Z1-6]
MKIGFDAKRAFLNTSGLGNYSRTTLNALHKYYSENEYTLFTPEIKIGLLENQDEFKIVAPPKSDSKLKKSFWRTFKLSEELKERQLNLFHGLSNELPKGIHKTNVPSLVTVHDLIFIRYPEFYKPFDKAIYFQKVKYACSAATKIVAISEQTKDDIVSFIGTDPNKIEIIHQAISPLFFEKAETARVKEKYKLPNEFILSVGTVEERKNQLSILKALQNINSSIPVIFVGNPTSYCNDIHKYTAAKNIKEQVIFLKNIPEKDLAAIYQLASLSIYISVFEGFGLPVIESMACKCPVITSNVSCLPETAGAAAVLCSPDNIELLGENIQKILTGHAFRDELIKKGEVRAEEFRPEKYVEKLISLYSELSK